VAGVSCVYQAVSWFAARVAVEAGVIMAWRLYAHHCAWFYRWTLLGAQARQSLATARHGISRLFTPLLRICTQHAAFAVHFALLAFVVCLGMVQVSGTIICAL